MVTRIWRLLIAAIILECTVASDEIRELHGTGDYRQILVSWESPRRSWFLLHYCELQAWGPSRCKAKTVDEDSGRERKDRSGLEYSALLTDLRMSTNYSITVERPGPRGGRRLSLFPYHHQHPLNRHGPPTIVVSTKGFSARAVSCLPEVSEVEVETGPHFSGRIGVESAGSGPQGPVSNGCTIDGDPTSTQQVYLLRISHEQCGSEVNDTSVRTYVLVQESSQLLTHSTRRFLVLCTFHPQTLTVRAGLNLPQTAEGMVEGSLNEISENGVHASPLRTVDLNSSDDSELGSVVGGVVAILGLGVVGLALWKYLPRSHGKHCDDESPSESYDSLDQRSSEPWNGEREAGGDEQGTDGEERSEPKVQFESKPETPSYDTAQSVHQQPVLQLESAYI